MKLTFKHFTLRRYLRYIRKQNDHIQHVHAFAFAGILTSLIAGFILYTEYGFWHERYVADDGLEVVETSFTPESPSESISSFWAEAKERFSWIGKPDGGFLEGKETYNKSEE